MTDVPRICKCCGAPLHGYKCEYCDVEYEKPIGMVSTDGRKKGILKFQRILSQKEIDALKNEYLSFNEIRRQFGKHSHSISQDGLYGERTKKALRRSKND